MSSALFGGSSASSRNKNLVEFKAGKMNLKGKMVEPDKRKGLVYVYQSEDSLMHLCWKDRANGIVEDDLMIFPDDVEIKRVTQCTTGRVFILKFKSSSKKIFFWMQENETDKDDKLWKKVNDYLNNPPPPGSASSGGSRGDRGVSSANLANVLGADFAGLEGPEIQNLIGSMSEQQLQMIFGNLGMPANSPSSNISGSSNVSSSQTSRVQSTAPADSRAEPASSNSNATTTTTTTSSESKPNDEKDSAKKSTTESTESGKNNDEDDQMDTK